MTNGLWQFLDICGKAITKLSITFILSLLFHSRMIWEVFGTRKYRTFYRCFLPNLRLALRFQRRRLKCEKLTDAGRQVMAKDHVAFGKAYLLTPPLCAGVSRVRALSSAWTGSPAQETLISRTHLFLPHDLPPTKKSSTIKSWPTFCDQYFWKFPIWNSRTDKNAERYEW